MIKPKLRLDKEKTMMKMHTKYGIVEYYESNLEEEYNRIQNQKTRKSTIFGRENVVQEGILPKRHTVYKHHTSDYDNNFEVNQNKKNKKKNVKWYESLVYCCSEKPSKNNNYRKRRQIKPNNNKPKRRSSLMNLRRESRRFK